MKIYVDGEMPKKCADCFCTNDGYGGYYDCDLYYVQNKEILDCDYYSEERPKDCPLQSLAEHDKQVRKQVVKEIKDRLNGFSYLMCSLECPSEVKYGVYVKDIIDVLDQIQNDSEVQNGK